MKNLLILFFSFFLLVSSQTDLFAETFVRSFTYVNQTYIVTLHMPLAPRNCGFPFMQTFSQAASDDAYASILGNTPLLWWGLERSGAQEVGVNVYSDLGSAFEPISIEIIWDGETVAEVDSPFDFNITSVWAGFTLPDDATDDDLFKLLQIRVNSISGPSSSTIFEMGNYVVRTGNVLTDDYETTYGGPIIQNILHDPPGDGSSAFMESGSSFCHGYGMSVAQDNSTSGWGAVKVGVSGSAGFIVETEFEAYAEFTADYSYSVGNTAENEYEVCYDITNTIETDNANPELIGKAGDLYIGVAMRYAYGLMNTINFDGCDFPTVTTSLAIAPLSAEESFIFTEYYVINNLIPELDASIASLPAGSVDLARAKQAKFAWENALAVNNEIYESANWGVGESQAGGPSQSYEYSATTSQVRYMETSIEIDMGIAVAAGVEVSGSGVSGGFETRVRQEIGSNNNASNSNTNTIGYTLSDDDIDDLLVLETSNDPVFGTGLFRLDEQSARTSCPYEGGYNLDQPALYIGSLNNTAAAQSNIPVGESATFDLFVCNDSNYERIYNLKVNAATNTSGAILFGFGENLNATDDGVELTVPANNCLTTADITVSSPTANAGIFDDIELYLVTCEGEGEPVETSVFLSASFGVSLNNDLPCDAYLLPTDGSIQGEYDNSTATSSAEEQAILPLSGNDCMNSWCETGSNEATNSLWFKFIAPSSGQVEISTCGMASFDTQIALYSVSDCNNYSTYSLLAANDDGSEPACTNYSSFMEVENLTPGNTYYLIVDGYDGQVGTFDIYVKAFGATSVQEAIARGPKLKVIPNPNQGQFRLQYNGLNDDGNLQIVNTLGTIVYEQHISGMANGQIEVDLQHLPAGIYLSRLGNERQLSVQKIIVE